MFSLVAAERDKFQNDQADILAYLREAAVSGQYSVKHADEIEHDAGDARRDDYKSEIPSDLLKSNYKQMKSSMTYPSHTGMIIIARFHVTFEKQL